MMSESDLSLQLDNNNITPSDSSNNNVENHKISNVPKDESSDISPPSSGASSKSTASKQSGIRPPSRIGRPCGGIQKPAIPTPPTKNSSDDSVRRLTDDFGRHRLTDLLEADESEEDALDLRSTSRRKRYSSIGSTASSMDGLWELHPRRLSEAGLSRHADSSAILTEDTDSFIIGQRVWVGGTKPGTIAYIGETQFAPGEWAGIALDEPIGKNDGSVAGIRYFQCENKKGVFSRLTRLTRVPLEQPGMGSNETFTSPNNGLRRSPISPTGSTRSLLKSPVSLTNSNTSLTSAHVDYKIGDRVIIKSTQGSKVGTVRYMGLTDFAPGEWVGVELDDPRGKNDGSVEGKRYFECRPNFGLFAPIAKVSKSPSKYKPGACVVHSGTGLPPSGMKKTNSKESLNSLASRSSIASSNVRRVRLGVTSLTPKKAPPKASSTPLPTRTALQDVLREKQQHIEQLLKERDLERAEITRAASQADDAEHRFIILKSEFEQYRSQCEAKARENAELLSQMKVDRTELLNQLEDERRRNEDLQFRFEEAAIGKSDIEENVLVQSMANESNIGRIRQLEALLADERQKLEQFESVSNKLFETEEGLIKAREELDGLRNELELTRQKRELLEQERTVSAELIDSLHKQLEGAGIENEAKSKTIDQLKEEVSKITSEHEIVKREAFNHKATLEEHCRSKDDEIHALKIKLAETEHRNVELMKENEKLKMDLSAKSHDLETIQEAVAHKNERIKFVEDRLGSVESELNDKINDLTRYKRQLKEVEENLKKDLDETRVVLKTKIAEVEDVKREAQIEVSQKDTQLKEATSTLAQNAEEIKKLHDELDDVKKNFEASTHEIHTRHARQVADQDSQLMALSAEIQQKNEEITKSSIVISKLEEDLCTKNSIIEKLRLQLEACEVHHSNYSTLTEELNGKIHYLQMNYAEIQGQLKIAEERIAALLQAKQNLEAQIQNMAMNYKGESAAQLEQLHRQIQEKDRLLEMTKAEYAEKLQALEKARYQIELQSQQHFDNYNKLKAELEKKLEVSYQSEQLLRKRCDNTVEELSKIRDEYKLKITDLEQSLQQKDILLNNLQGKCTETERYYQDQLNALSADLNRNMQAYQDKLARLNEESLRAKEELNRKSEEAIELDAKCNHILAQMQQKENEIKQSYGDTIRKLEFDLNEKNGELMKAQNEIALLKNDCKNVSSDSTTKDHRISELVVELQKSQNLAAQLQDQLSAIQLQYQQKMQEHEDAQNQCKGLLEEVANLRKNAQGQQSVFNNLQIEYNNSRQLMDRLRLTERQKQQCLEQLEKEAKSNGDMENCSQLKNMLNQMKVDNGDQNADKILQLQNQLQIIQNQLGDRNNEFESQKNEILRLQQELLKAREASQACMGGQLDQNSVRFNNTPNTQHNTLMHESSTLNPLELQVQLAIVKNSLRQISSKFQLLQRENNYLLARLQNALKNGNLDAVNDALRRFDQFKRQSVILHNIVQKENFNLQKRIQDCMLHLQQKNKLLNECRLNVNNLQNVVHNLPIQCRAFINGGGRAEDVVNKCANSDIDFKKLNDLLANKEQRIQQLQNQLGNLLVECNNQRAQSLVATQKPSAFMPSNIDFKKLNDLLANKEQRIQQLQNQLGNLLVECNNNQRGQSFVATQKPSAFMPSNIDFKKLNDLLANKEQRIQQLQNQLGNLLVECNNNQRGQSFVGTQKPSAFMPSDIDYKKLNDLLGNKEQRIQQLQNQLGNLLVQCNNQQRGQSFVGTQKPSAFIPSKTQIQKVTEVKQAPPKIIRIPVPVPQKPQVIVKTVYVPQINGRRCPPPKIERVEVPKYITRQVPFQVKVSQCILPDFSQLYNCESPKDITDKIDLKGYKPSEVFKFKQTLLSLLTRQRNCAITSSQNFNCPKLPSLVVPQNCGSSPQQIVKNLYINGYASSDANSFRQSLFQLLNKVQQCQIQVNKGTPWNANQQWPFLLKQQQNQLTCQRLPDLPTPVGCNNPSKIVNNLVLNGYSSSVVNNYKQSLLKLLNSVRYCALSSKWASGPSSGSPWLQGKVNAEAGCGYLKLPSLVVPDNCMSPMEIVQHVTVNGFGDTEVREYKNSLLNLLHSLEGCYCSKEQRKRAGHACVLPRFPKLNRHLSPNEIINVLNAWQCSDWRSDIFRHELFDFVISQQRYCRPTMFRVPQSVKIPVYVKVPVQVPRVVKVPVIIPKIIVKTREVPVKVPVIVKVPQQPKVLIKQIPVYIPQKPKVIIKEVPVDKQGNNNVVIKQVAVPVQLPPKIITKEVAVKVPVMIKVPYQVRVPVKVPVYQRIKVEVPVKVPVQVKTPVIKQVPVYVKVPVPQPPKIIIQKVPYQVIVEKRVPVYLRSPVVTKPNVQTVKVPIFQTKTLIKKVLVPGPTKTIVKQIPVMVNSQAKPKVIIKQVPVQLPPRIIIKQVSVKVPIRVPVPVQIRVPVQVPVKVPVEKIITKIVQVPVRVVVPCGTKDEVPGYGTPGYGIPGYGTPGSGTPGYGITGVPGSGTPGYGTPGFGSPGYGIPGVPGSGTPGYGVPGYGVPGYGTPGYGTPGYGVPGYGTPGYGTPGSGTPAYGIPGVPGSGTPGYGVPGYGVPGYGTPESGTPGYGIPGVPGSGTPGYGIPGHGTPGYGIPGTPGYGIPGYGTPGSGTPESGTPSYGIPGLPGSETPGYGTPGYGIPGTPGSGTPGYGTHGYGTPGYGTPGYGIPGTPGYGIPGYGVPGSGTPGYGIPGYGVPGSGTPGYGIPGYGTPGYGIPGVPGSGTPGYGIPGSETPGFGVPGYGTPGYGIPGMPGSGTPGFGKPGYGTSESGTPGYGIVKEISIPQPPKIIVKQIPVMVKSEPKILIKQVPILVTSKCKPLIKQVPVTVQSAPKIIIKQVAVKIPVPVRVVVPCGTKNEVPGYGTPGYGTPGYGTPGYGTPGYGIPGSGTPGYGTPGSGKSEYDTPEYGTPGYGIPGFGTPGSGTPGSGIPGYGIPGYGIPGSGTPGYGIPGYGTPGYGIPGVPGSGTPGYGTPGSGVQKCKPVIQQVFVPVKQTVKVPKIVIKTVSVPVKIAVPVPVQQPAKILVKQVPVYITQKPKIIIKQVPVYLTKKDKVKIIVKEKIVPVQLPPRTLIKEIPVQIKVPIRVPVPVRMVVKVPVPVKQIVEVPKVVVKKVFVPAIQTESSMKQLPVQSPRVIVKEVPVKVYVKVPIKVPVEVPQYSAKDTQLPLKVVTKQVPVYIPQKPRIIVQQVPIYTKCKNKVNVVVRERPVPVQLPPKTMIKEVPVKVYVKVPVEVPKYIVKNIQIPPRILTKQVPVYVPQPARTIIKQVPIYINGQNKVIVKEKQVRVPSPPRVIVKEVPVRIPIQVKVPVQQIVKVPQVVVKEVRVPVAQPPKIIVKQVPVYIPQSPTSGVPQKTLTNLETQDKPFKNYDVPVKYIQVPPKVITKQVPIYIPQRPRVIIKQVPVGVNCQGKVNVIVKEKPVPILSPPRIVTKEVRVPVKQIVQVPKVVIKEVQVPKMVIQKVFVPGKTKTRVVIREKQVPIVKEVPTKVYVKVPVEIPKYIVKYVQLPPRYITRQVPVYIPQRPRIIVKQVPIYISGKDKIKVIMKERPVAVPSSPRIITKVVRVPIKEVVEVPKIVLQQVRIPVQQPPKIITQKVFVPGETQTRVVEKQVPVKVYVKVPVDRVVYKQAPGCIPQRPQIVIKQVPVYISGGNKPGMNMNDNLMQIPSSHINTGEGRVPSKQLFGLPDGGDGQVQQSPRVIIQKVFVPGKTKTQVVIREKQVPVVKEVPVKVYVKVPVEVPKYIVKHIQLPPKVITKQIPVYIPQRAQIVVKQVPIYITGKDKVKVIVKEKPVPVLSPPRVITKEVKVPVKEIVEIPKIVLKEVRIPVQQPPKIITQKVFVPGETQTKVMVKQVPVKVYVKVPVDRVVYKQAPGWIPQRPQIVIKQVPVYISGGNKPGMNMNDNLMQVPSSNTGEGRVPSKQLFGLPDGGDGQVQQSPRVIIQKVFVPGKPRTEVVIKQVPVVKEVPVKVYVKVPVEVPKYIVKHIQLPPRVITKQVPVYIPQRPQIVVKQVPIYITGKDKVKVIVKEKPVPVLSSPRIITKEVKVPVKQIVEVPKIVVKEVRVPLVQPPQIITRNVPVYINQPPKVIIQRVPVSGKVKTKVIVKQVPVVNYVKVPVEVPRYIVKNIHLPPKIITKQVAVYVPQPAKVVVKQVPIYVKGQHKVKVIVKERPVPVPSPPRVIVKEVPVRVPIEVKVPVQQIVKVPQVIVKEVRVPVVQPARIITKQVPVYISQPPRIITQKVLVPGRTQVKVVVREKPVIKQVPVKVYVKVPVKTLVEVPKHPGQNIQIPAKVITKQVPVYIPQRPQIIIKQVPVYAKCENKPNVIIKEKPVMVPSAPRIIIKEVQVPMRGTVESPEMFGKQKQYPGQSSGRIIIKEVKVPVAIPKYIVKNVHVPPKIITKQVPVYVPQRPQIVIKQVPVYMSCNNKPNVVVKERIVSVPSPPRIITKEVPVRVPVEVRVPVKQVVKIPHIVVKETRIPVTQPAQIITKQVPVYIRQPPQIITKVVVKEKRVPIQLPARTIVKEVPVRIYVKVPVGVPVDGTKYHGNGVPGLENGQVPFKQNIGVPNSNANEGDLLQPYSGNNIPGFENGRVPFNQNIGVPNSNVNEDGLLQPYGGSNIPGLGYAKVPFNQNINVPNTNVNDGRVLQRPQIIVKQVPIYIPQKPKIIIKQVPVMAFGNKPKIIIKERPVLVQMPPRTIIKQVPVNVPVRVPVQIPVEKLVYVRVPVKVEVPRIVEKIVRVPVGGQVPNTGTGQQRVPVVIRQPAQIIYKTVNVCNKPRYIIKQVPVEKKVPIVIKQIVSTPCKESPPRIIHVPLPCPQQGNDYGITSPNSDNLKTAVPQVPLYVNVPRKPQVIIKTVMVPQVCRPVIKQVPVKVPAQIITKPVYIKTSVPVRVPQIVEKVVKVIQQVPIPQPPKIIEKQVPVTVQLPPKLLIKKVFVPIFNGTRCPVPKVVVEKVLVSQPPKIITKPVLVPIKVPPKVLIKQVAVPCVAPIVPTTSSCNYLPSLPVPSGCIHPANYVKQLSLQGYPVRNVLIFKDNLLQIFNKQFSCGSPYQDLIKKQRLQIGQLKNYLIGKEAKQPNCNLYRQYLMQQVSKTAKYYKSQICKYRKVMYRLKARLNRILRANNNPSVNNLRSVFGNNQLPAVPIPMMHVMKSLTPSIPLRAFQQVAPTTTATSIAFVKNLHAVYKNTQEALAHCMDAILAQTLTYKQINSKCSNCTQLIQDKELAENQIRFLNSIIVDIQKKNEEQKARIQILEKGYSPGMADELKMIGLPEQRQQPPRVYCDICEEFDLHETEDCPRQNSDLDPPPNQGERQLPQQRPYCEICEEFGHATEDCKEDQTF